MMVCIIRIINKGRQAPIDDGYLAGSDLAVLPYNEVLTGPQLTALEQFVLSGGKLMVHFQLADRIAVMEHGIVRQVGKPWEIYVRPEDTFVAGLSMGGYGAFKLALAHLAVAHIQAGFRHKVAYPVGFLLNAQHPVVHIKNLSAAIHLS